LAGQCLDATGELTGGSIDLAAVGASAATHRLGFRGRGGFAENPELPAVGDSSDAGDIADHVVVEHRQDGATAVHQLLSQCGAAVEPLFLTGQSGVYDSIVKSMVAEHSRRLDHPCHARSIVIGTW